CLEARENALLLILLPVFDTGLFIALLYLPYSLRVGYLSARLSLNSYGSPRPNKYFTESRQGIFLITGRFDSLEQLDEFSRSF
uniref:Photosystem II cytochrome b559 alpha subunit lumenal region domain-containing protein n=1 Tax=Aegilops tauschii subsp. strangulata TaxID=200361 RepID=A0A453D7W3_AEGTS